MSHGTTRDNNPPADANMEPYPSDAPDGTDQITAFSSPVRITFYHTRKRLADMDGLSGKAAIDGLVAIGILTDDTAQQVKEIRNYQTKGNVEETRILIEAINP